MKVSESLDKIQYTLLTGNPEAEVDEVAYDSRKAAKDAVFVCIKGTKTDSHDFIPQVFPLVPVTPMQTIFRAG